MATAWLSLFVSAGSSGFIYSIFIPDMMADLDWPRSVLVAAASLSTVAGSFAGPVIGRFIDLRGARLVMAVSLLAISGSTLLMWGIQEPWQLFLLYGIIGGAARMTLQQVAPGAMVAQWFLRRRPLAFSLTALGPPASSLVLPPIIAVLIVSLGWRPTWAVLAIVGLAIGLPPILLLVRRRPEDMGLYPDGDAAPAAPGGPVASLLAKGRRVGEEWSFSEAVHNLGFWVLATSMALISVAPNASSIFMFPYFSDQGLSPTAAAATLSVMSLFQVISRIAFWAPVIARLGSVRYALLLWGGLLFITTVLTPFSKTEPQPTQSPPSSAWPWAATWCCNFRYGRSTSAVSRWAPSVAPRSWSTASSPRWRPWRPPPSWTPPATTLCSTASLRPVCWRALSSSCWWANPPGGRSLGR